MDLYILLCVSRQSCAWFTYLCVPQHRTTRKESGLPPVRTPNTNLRKETQVNNTHTPCLYLHIVLCDLPAPRLWLPR